MLCFSLYKGNISPLNLINVISIGTCNVDVLFLFQTRCNSFGAHVVFVDDDAEDDFIRTFTRADRESVLL